MLKKFLVEISGDAHIAAYRTLLLNGYEKVTIVNAVLIPRWTYRGLFLGNRSQMAMWGDILLQYLRDTPGIEQQMNKHRLTTNLSHGGLGLRQLWWSYITRWVTLGQQELQNNGPTQQKYRHRPGPWGYGRSPYLPTQTAPPLSRGPVRLRKLGGGPGN